MKISKILLFILLIIISIFYLVPFYLVFISAFKEKSFILEYPFRLPYSYSLKYFKNGVKLVNYFDALKNSLFITIISIVLIILTTSITGWIITRIKNRLTKVLYNLFLLSIVVPFQLLMYPMIYISSKYLYLDNVYGIIILYVGFGAGMSVFLYSGFIKSIPVEIEEASLIDGCRPIETFWYIIFPILKPTTVTVVILNMMWIWNDYLLPYYILPSDMRTIPLAINSLIGDFGTVAYSEMTALITISILPIIIVYILLQKLIIEGITSGSVKM